METFVLCLFCSLLLLCLIAGIPVLYALSGGLLLFCLYAKHKGFSAKEILRMIFRSIYTIKNLLLVFLLVGMLTGLWRASGTIPTFLCYTSEFFEPRIFLLVAFLLNCILSFFTGTSLGTVATIGVITMSVGTILHIPSALLGGAILSGAYFGDRCSPFSTSAMLVRELTGTNIYSNIQNMFRSAAIPFFLTCLIYLTISLTFSSGSAASVDPSSLFAQVFFLHPILLLPTVLVLFAALLRLDIKLSMLLGILSSAALCLIFQHTDFISLLKILWRGYYASDPALNNILQGGGIVSMLTATVVVCITCSYVELFKCTGLLNGIQMQFEKICRRLGTFSGTFCACILIAAISCNQTLSILLTHQLCKEVEKDAHRLALILEDTAVLIPALLPWSIACSAPLACAGAPTQSVIYAFFLWLVPAFGIIREQSLFRVNA